MAEVADAVEVLARLDPRSLHDVLVQGEARARRADGKGTANLSGAGDRGDVPLREAPEVELPPGGSGQSARGSLGPHRQQVLLLGRDDLWRVDLEQGLALLDRVAGLVDVNPLHPAGEAKVDGRDLILADLDLADGPHVAEDGLASNGLDSRAHVLDHHRIDGNGTRRRLARRLVLVDGNQIHPHRGLPGLFRDVGRVHRRDPVLDLPLPGIGLRGRSRRRGAWRANRSQLHSADRTGSGPLLDQVRVHPAAVELRILGRARHLRRRRRSLLTAGQEECAGCHEDEDESHHRRPPRGTVPMVASAAAAWMRVSAVAVSRVRSRSRRATSASKSAAKSARSTLYSE